MANEQKWTLDEQVAKAIGNYGKNSAQYRGVRARVDPNELMQNALLAQRGVEVEGDIAQTNAIVVEKKRKEELTALGAQAKPHYDALKANYIANLSDAAKAQLYFNVLKEGLLPAESSEDLQKIMQMVIQTTNLEYTANSANGERLGEILQNEFQSDPETLLLKNSYGGRGNIGGLRRLTRKIAEQAKRQAIAMVKEGKVYGEVDKLIEGSDLAMGAAASSAYELYNSEPETAYREAKAAKEGK